MSGKADSSLSVHSVLALDTSVVPGASRSTAASTTSMTMPQTLVPPPAEPPAVPQGPPRETLESILVALDTEK